MRWKNALAAAAAIVALALTLTLVLRAIDRRRGAADGRATPTLADGHTSHLYHCGMHPQVVQDHPGDCPICHMALTPMGSGPTSGEPSAEAAGPAVMIDPTVVQNMGVRTAAVTRGPLHKTVRALGVLKLPEAGLHDVSLKVGGWVDKLYADQEGMHVTRGEPLFDLYSPDLQVAEQELIAASRAERSLTADAGPDARREARGLVDSARRKLLLWDVAEQDVDAIANAEQPPRDVPFRSPATGHLADKAVVQGSAVQPMTKLLQVADHTKLWLDAQVYAAQMPLVKQGQAVTATVEGVPGRHGRASSPSSTRTSST